jgi:hypothetical protein
MNRKAFCSFSFYKVTLYNASFYAAPLEIWLYNSWLKPIGMHLS